MIHLATGDLFRDLMATDSPLATEVRAYYDSGNLVPDELTGRVLFDALDQRARDGDVAGALFDGFPRNDAQSEVLDRQVEARGEQLAAVEPRQPGAGVERARGGGTAVLWGTLGHPVGA